MQGGKNESASEDQFSGCTFVQHLQSPRYNPQYWITEEEREDEKKKSEEEEQEED